MIAYVDSSALVKRILDEPESEVVLDVWSRADDVVSSEVAYAETRAALAAICRARRADAAGHRSAMSEAERLFGDLRLIRTDEAIVTAAGGLAERHALDEPEAIQLAAALSVDAPRIVVTTWNRALSGAASECGMPVVPRLPPRVGAGADGSGQRLD